jgi:hypothetical protein
VFGRLGVDGRIILDKKFWENLVAYFSFIGHALHRKRRVQQFFDCYVCIRYRGNVFTKPLPINDRGTFSEPLLSNETGLHTG